MVGGYEQYIDPCQQLQILVANRLNMDMFNDIFVCTSELYILDTPFKYSNMFFDIDAAFHVS